MHDRDRRARKRDTLVLGSDRGGVPRRDVPEEDLRDRVAVELERLRDALEVVGDRDATEDGGDLERAADGYKDAAARWTDFGVVAEEAFASLGRGRCLVGLSRFVDAAGDLHRAREIFERLGVPRELGEIDSLLAQDVAR